MRKYQIDNRLDITEYEIIRSSVSLTKTLTIALIADLHDRPYEKILASLKERRPDLIAIAGDLIDGYTADGMENRSKNELTRMPKSMLADSAYALQFLKECAAVSPTYYGLGNHEWLLSDRDFKLIHRTGVHLLDNAFAEFPSSRSNICKASGNTAPVLLPDKKDRILIGGLTSSAVMRYREYILENPKMAGYYPLFPPRPWWQKRRNTHPHLDYAWLDEFEQQDGFKILLCHHPEYWKRKDPVLSEMDFGLTMSGHAHGGQIRVLGHGLFAPGQGLLPKYTGGSHNGRHGTLVVSRGLANTAPFPRFGNRPELVYIRLS